MCIVLKKLVHAFKLICLSLGIVVFVCGTPIEWQRIVRVLWVLLMEDIVFAIVPVGERSVVGARLLDWLWSFLDLSMLSLSSLALFTSELCLVGSVHIHSVWVDDLALFLKVKGLLMAFNFCFDKFI